VLCARVDEDYFRTMAIPLRRGRGIARNDTVDAPLVAVVNETFAGRYWPGQDPIGRRVRLDDRSGRFAEIVGIAADSKYTWIAEAPTAFAYCAHAQAPDQESTVLVHTFGSPAGVALAGTVRAIDPNMPAFGVRTMDDFYYSRAVHATGLITGSVAAMGSTGLLLSMIGLYGLIAYATERRTREIGIRIAVGAAPWSAFMMVVRQAFTLVVIGMAAGIGTSAAAARLLLAAFPDAGTFDGAAYSIVISLLALTAIVAVYAPARRAERVDPIIALRSE
jgi:hypothetical protein